MTRNQKILFYIAWTQATIASLGSFYFSEIAHFPPCTLCWYQRISMYPLVIILFIGLYLKDYRAAIYGLSLSLIGTVISIYHNLLYYQILPESAAPCIMGISCTTKFIQWFGFMTIPLLSLSGFLVIDVCLILVLKAKFKK